MHPPRHAVFWPPGTPAPFSKAHARTRFGIAFKARNSQPPPSLPKLPPLSAFNAVWRFEFLQPFPSLLSLCPSLSFSSSPMHPRHVHEPHYSTPAPSSLPIRGSRGVPPSRSLAPDPLSY
ncbi:hypothetical protein HETIRDRAFT_102081 [Heterobasidion irregulare TC 32-1]|uniref:Uncharacterized protein n=1 Tax=Heterobasidion irregulare (strain TC 32-1) TaxID=747525 RepID=W4K7H8_HETIT|nr:uncharacterized protein HETIRDRAFT_102081 [Heterobasidion irregulare TC 32-1]ETW81021.1 hypothetical protein HETIRDRAFT_102081 [Heterobasidion irregulare TC 32-1]